MVNKMHWMILVSSLMVCGLSGGSFYVTAQECSSIPLSDPTRVVVTPPQSGGNYSFYERVTLSCNSSGEYTFTGNDYSYCEGNNQWNPDPSTVICYEKCADSLIPPDVIQEDSGGTTRNYYEHGEYIYLSCPASQTLIGPSRVTCLDGSIGDTTVSCEGGTTTVVPTAKQTTMSSAPSTTAQQYETTLAFQTIINTATGSTTAHDGGTTIGRTDAATQVQTKQLTSVDYITLGTTSVEPTTISATTEQQTVASTNVPLTSTQFMTTDVYEPTTFETGISTDTPEFTTNLNPLLTTNTSTTTANTGNLTTMVTDNPPSSSTSFMGTDEYEATTDQTAISTETSGRTTNTDPVVTILTRGLTEEVTSAFTDEAVTSSTDLTRTDVEEVTSLQTVVGTDTPESTSAAESPVTYVTQNTTSSTDEMATEGTELATDFTDVATEGVTTETEGVTTEADPTITMVVTELETSLFTELPGTESDYVTTLATDVSATDGDDVTTSVTEVTELVSTGVTVITEVITEVDEFTTSASNITTLKPDPCEGLCDPNRERCVTGLDGPECECLPGFYRIAEDEAETDVECIEAILFEVDARITEIDGQAVEFSEDLKNSSSVRFNYLEDLICSTVAAIQDSLSGFLGCQVTSFSNGSIVAAIDLYFDELSDATEIEVYNETVAAFEANNITAEVTRVELIIPSTSTTVTAATATQTTTTTTEHRTSGRTTHTLKPTEPSGTTDVTSQTQTPTMQSVTTARPAKSTADTTLLVLYILIPVLAVLLLIAVGFILYQNKKVSSQYGFHNPGGRKGEKQKKKGKTSSEDTNGNVNMAFYDGITIGIDKYTQTLGPQPSGDDRPDSGVVVSEDIDHMVYPYPWNEPGRLEGDYNVEKADDAEKVIYAKVDRKSVKENGVTNKNPPVIVEIELKPVVVEEAQSPPVDWDALDSALDAVEKDMPSSEAVKDDSDHNSDDPHTAQVQLDDTGNEENEAEDSSSQTEIDGEPDYITIGGFELNESSNQGTASREDDTLNLDAISLELTSTMETEMDKRLSHRSTPC